MSRFDPLGRILCYDDLDRGLQGWSELIGNYEGSLDSMLPEYCHMRPRQSLWRLAGIAGTVPLGAQIKVVAYLALKS